MSDLCVQNQSILYIARRLYSFLWPNSLFLQNSKAKLFFFEIADNFIGWYLQIVKFKWSQWFWASAKVVFNSNNSKWELRFWHITKPVGQSNFALWVADITDKTDITESKNRYVTLISSGILGVKRIFIRSCDEIAWVWRKKV